MDPDRTDLQEQSERGLHCLAKRPLKQFVHQTTKAVDFCCNCPFRG